MPKTELSQLPEPDVYLIVADNGKYAEAGGDYGDPYFNADQMREYAAEEVAAERAERLKRVEAVCDVLRVELNIQAQELRILERRFSSIAAAGVWT